MECTHGGEDQTDKQGLSLRERETQTHTHTHREREKGQGADNLFNACSDRQF